MTPVRLEPAAPRPRAKHSTTEPLRSLTNFSKTFRMCVSVSRNLFGFGGIVSFSLFGCA